MGIIINSATWGDENYTTPVTETLRQEAKKGYLDLTAGASLVPSIDLLSGRNTIELSDDEKTEIKKSATEVCKSASDEKCMTFHINQFQSNLLQKKVLEKQASDNIVTGRRLTLDYTDEETGRTYKVTIPDGQRIKAGEIPEPSSLPLPSLPELPAFSEFTPTGAALTTLSYVAQGLLALLWVFSIAVTYHLLMRAGKTILAYVLTAISIIIPYSGLILTPIALAYFKYMESKAAIKVVPLE
jgi:hypothetical protein